MARETGLPSNQEFPASVSGVTGGFVSRAAGWGRKERKRMKGCTLTSKTVTPETVSLWVEGSPEENP